MHGSLRRKLGVVLSVGALALLLAGCSKCDDFWWEKPRPPQTCHAGPAPG